MRVVWSNVAKKELSRIDSRYQKRIEERLSSLNDRSAPKPDLRKMSATENHYRLRVGDYRIILTMDDGEPSVCHVLSVKRRTSTNYLHEECVPYGRSNN